MGQKLVVHTDHLNLLYKKLASARLIRRQMLLEEFGPRVEHIESKKNVIADTLSCLDLSPKQHDTIDDTETTTQLSYVNQTDIDEVSSEAFPMLPKTIKKLQKRIKS